MIKKIMIFLLILLSISFPVYAVEEEKNDESNDVEIDSPSAFLLETSTNTTIYQKNAYEHRAPASMTKIMTMILVMEEIDNGNIKESDLFTVSKNAERMGGTTIYLDVGEEMSVKDLLKGLALTSANDASIVLAEGISGTVNKFVERMNNKAKEIGCNDTNFVNPNGLPQKNHYSCAHDMGLMGSYLVTKHPDILKYTSIYEDYLRKGTKKEFWLVNTNKLVKFYPSVDGLKTGWTNDAGYCLTATANENGIRFVAVVIGAESPKERNSEIMKLINYGKSIYQINVIYPKGTELAKVHDIRKTPKDYILYAKEDISVLKQKGEKQVITEKIDYQNNNITIYVNGREYKTFNLITKEEVNEANIFKITNNLIQIVFFEK